MTNDDIHVVIFISVYGYFMFIDIIIVIIIIIILLSSSSSLLPSDTFPDISL